MNVTEAIHVQTLLTWLTDPHAIAPDLADAARDAATALTAAAHDRLGAGTTSAKVTAGWAALLTGCAGCPTCLPETPPDERQQLEGGDRDDPAGGGDGAARDRADAAEDDRFTRGVLTGRLA